MMIQRDRSSKMKRRLVVLRCADGQLVDVPVPEDNAFFCGLAECEDADAAVPFDGFGSGAVKNMVRLLDGQEVDPSLCGLDELEALARFVGAPTTSIATGTVRQRYALFKHAPDLHEITLLECAQRRAIARAGDGHAPFSTLVDLSEGLPTRPAAASVPRLFDERLFERDNAPRRGGRTFMTQDVALTHLVDRVLRLGNVVAAGGCAVDLMGIAPGSDVDFFLWGLPSPEAATEHLGRVVRELGQRHQIASMYVSDNAVTVHLLPPPSRGRRNKLTVQIILRLYGSPDEILHGFDIPACKACAVVVDDRRRYYGTASFVKSATERIVWVDPERQSMSYATRLGKYWAKGFDVLLPGLADRKRIDPEIYACNPKDLHGMALLLRIEREMRAVSYEKQHRKTDTCCAICVLAAALKRLRTTGCQEHDYMMRAAKSAGSTSLTYLRGVVLTLWRGMTRAARVPGDSIKRLENLSWTVRDPGSQTVSGSFHPERHDFYEGIEA